jgi:pyrimidine-specific ribonucleoside hydrolase
METADPDDAFTLCMLYSHPKVNLVGVTITPGSLQQVNLVEDLLARLGKNIPIGVKNFNHPKSCVSEFHYKWLRDYLSLKEYYEAPPDGGDLIAAAIKQHGDTKIVSGAGLGCVAQYLTKYNTELDEVVIQGGFAGDNVVPEELRLAKFNGKTTCPTFNLNADVEAAKLIASTKQIKKKLFVSKNVCHGIIYDNEMHERIKPHRHNNVGLDLLVDGMDFYLNKNKHGKAFHDPLAACVAIDQSIVTFKEVEIYRERGEWGARLADGTNTFISIAVDRPAFENILIGKGR